MPFNSFTNLTPTTPPKFFPAHASLIFRKSHAVLILNMRKVFDPALPTPQISSTAVFCKASICCCGVCKISTPLVPNLSFLANLLATLDNTLDGATPTETGIPVHNSVVCFTNMA